MTTTPQSKPTIYLADDDPDDQELLLNAFRQLTDTHHLRLVSNGKELIDLLSGLNDQALPCLIVLDYNMPGLNGKQILAWLQSEARYREIPKVIYTTSSSFIEKTDFLSIGARDFLTKESSIKDILSSARKMLSYCDDEVRQSA